MKTSLLAEFRREIKDTRHSVQAFDFAVHDDDATAALLEVNTEGHLVLTMTGGTTISFDLDLSDPRYSSLGDLVEYLQRMTNVVATKASWFDAEHASTDLEAFGPTEVLSTGMSLKHRMFSDVELEEVLTRAIQRHNPSFSIATLPQQEVGFVFQLARASICRVQAQDAVKRRGLESTVADLLRMAESHETAYANDVRRLARAITTPKEANPNTAGSGDIVVGSLYRRNLRTGTIAPGAANLPPDPAVINDPAGSDIEDDNVRISWQKNRNNDFYSQELWMDSRSEVVRQRDASGTTARQTTSTLIFRSFGANASSHVANFATYIEQIGQDVSAVVVKNLEPETEYFFKLYLMDLNNAVSDSRVVRAVTKALRAKFAATNALSTATGPAGTAVTITLDDDAAAFTSSHVFKVGEKVVTPVISSSFEIVVTIPTFVRPKPLTKDLLIISPNGLTSVMKDAFQVTE